MKIDIWTPDILDSGGITSVTREMAAALFDLGHNLCLFGLFDRSGRWKSIPLQGTLALPKPFRALGFVVRVLFSCTMRHPDHVVSTHLNFGPVAHWAKCLLGIPFTLVTHGVEVHGHLSHTRIAALRAADRVLAVSSWTRQRVLDVGSIDPARVVVLPNTVDEVRFTVAERSEELAKHYSLQDDERLILTVARLDPGEGYKGCDRTLQALPIIQRACGRVRFLVVGKGDDRARLEVIARKLGVAESVTFAGFIPDAELADHYRLADVFAMPSTGEGFGIVFLEAMACGTPVLAGNRDGSVDALDGGRLGQLVDPTDVSAIANGIISLLKQEGPAWWFDRQVLHDAVIKRFGRAAFRQRLREVLPF